MNSGVPERADGAQRVVGRNELLQVHRGEQRFLHHVGSPHRIRSAYRYGYAAHSTASDHPLDPVVARAKVTNLLGLLPKGAVRQRDGRLGSTQKQLHRTRDRWHRERAERLPGIQQAGHSQMRCDLTSPRGDTPARSARPSRSRCARGTPAVPASAAREREPGQQPRPRGPRPPRSAGCSRTPGFPGAR